MAGPTPRVPMPVERPVTLFLNDQELVTVQATPVDLADWALGFLYTEGLVRSSDEVQRLAVEPDRGLIWADLPALPRRDRLLGRRRYLTSGCGGGVTFSSVRDAMGLAPVAHDLQVRREGLAHWMAQLGSRTPLYHQTGGMHAAGLVRVESGEMLVREDIGRHNAVDKAIGAALRAGWPAAGLVMLTSGRISYEMCAKLGRYGIGLGASRTAVTDQACRLAERLGIELVGYLRTAEQMTVYTSGRRLLEGS